MKGEPPPRDRDVDEQLAHELETGEFEAVDVDRGGT
jgi:hypothetical protein